MQNGWETHTPKEKKHEFKDNYVIKVHRHIRCIKKGNVRQNVDWTIICHTKGC